MGVAVDRDPFGAAVGRSRTNHPMVSQLSDWSAERKALVVAVVVIAAVSIAGSLLDIPFGMRSSLAVTAGIIALVITSYLLTGSLLPPESA